MKNLSKTANMNAKNFEKFLSGVIDDHYVARIKRQISFWDRKTSSIRCKWVTFYGTHNFTRDWSNFRQDYTMETEKPSF